MFEKTSAVNEGKKHAAPFLPREVFLDMTKVSNGERQIKVSELSHQSP